MRRASGRGCVSTIRCLAFVMFQVGMHKQLVIMVTQQTVDHKSPGHIQQADHIHVGNRCHNFQYAERNAAILKCWRRSGKEAGKQPGNR